MPQSLQGVSNRNPRILKRFTQPLSLGMPIENAMELIYHLELDSESINNWKAGVARALKRYIADGIETAGKCSSCGSDQVVYQEGCLTCKNCGNSKCA